MALHIQIGWRMLKIPKVWWVQHHHGLQSKSRRVDGSRFWDIGNTRWIKPHQRMCAMVKTWNEWAMDMPPSYMGLSYHGYINWNQFKRTRDHHLLWENTPRSWTITCCYADPSKTLSKRQLLVIIPMSSCDVKNNLSWDVLGKHNPVLARWSRQAVIAVQPNHFGDLKEVGMYKTPPPVKVYWCESISWHLVEQLPISFTMILKIGFQSPNLAKKRAAAHLLFTSPHAESHEPWSRTVRWRKHWTFRAKWAIPVFGHSHIQPHSACN